MTTTPLAADFNREIPEGIPETGLLPRGLILMEIENIEPGLTSTNKYAENVAMRALEPPDVAGMPHTEMYVVGNDTDPLAEDPQTWKKTFGSRNLRTMAARAGVEWRGDLKACRAALKGQKVLISMTKELEPAQRKDPQTGEMVDNQFAGRQRNRIAAYYEPGKRTPQVFADPDEDAAPATARPNGPAGAPRPAAAPLTAAAPPPPVAAPTARPQ